MFAFALLDDATAPRARVATISASSRSVLRLHRDGALVFAWEFKAVTRVLGRPNCESTPRVLVRVDPVLLGPRPAVCNRGRSRSSPPGSWAEMRPDGFVGRASLLGSIAEVAAAAADDPPRDLPSGRGGLGRGASGVRCARVDVPQRRPRLEHRDRARQAARVRASDAYTIRFRREDQLFEAMPDDAHYAASGRAPVRHRLARDRDRSPTSSTCSPRMGGCARRARGRSCSHQHLAHLRECPRRRREGCSSRGWVPTSSSAATGSTPPASWHPAINACHGSTATRRGACGGSAYRWRSGATACDPVRWAKRCLTFAELPEEAAFRRSYTLYGADEVLDVDRRPGLEGVCRRRRARAPGRLRRHGVGRSRQPNVPRRRTAVPPPVDDLAYTDRASMAASTEVRVPFVDVELVPRHVRPPRLGQGAWSPREARPQGGGRGMAPARHRLPAEGLIRRAHSRGSRVTSARSWTKCFSTASS